MSEVDQPYADTVAALLNQDYRIEDVTLPEVVNEALDQWLRKQTDAAIAHHAATTGHLPEDHCEAWYALQDSLTHMHAVSRRFVMELLAQKQGS